MIENDWRVVHLVHDSIILEIEDRWVSECTKQIAETMIGMGNRYFPEVKWACEVESADRWYEKRPTEDDFNNYLAKEL